DDRTGAWSDETGDLFRIRNETVLRPARVVDRLAAIERDGGSPERIVRARNKYFVALVEKRAQNQIDELAHAVTDKDFFRRNTGDAALLLLHHYRFTRREDALLMAVTFRLGQVLDHRQAHRFGGAEAEGFRVADVQGDDFVALALELMSPMG